MKRFRRSTAAVIMAMMIGNAAQASTGSLIEFRPQVMPVLVHVDSHGKVTEISPSSQLAPSLKKLLADSLDSWIDRPGMANGRPVNTAMIVNVALKTEPRADGRYDANFAYVSSYASPFFSAHWASINGHDLALVDNTGSYHNNPNVVSHQYMDRSLSSTFQNHQSQAAPQPSIQTQTAVGASSSSSKSH